MTAAAARPPRDTDAADAPEPRRIGLGVRLLHWAAAALVVGSFSVAWAFNALGPGQLSAWLVEAHRSIGLVTLGLLLVRVAWRLTHPLPPLPDTTATWERVLAGAVQFGLYACLLAMPLIGWLGSTAQGDAVTVLGLVRLPDVIDADQPLADLLFGVHETLGFILLGLIGLHVAGALRHQFIKRDAVLRTMINGAAR